MFAPPQFKNVSLLNYKVTDENKKMFMAASEFATDFNDKTKSGLLLHGTTGVGKTHLAFSIGSHISDKGYWPYFINWVDFLTKIKRSWNDENLHESIIKYPVLTRPIVIIDDIGAEMMGRGEQNWVSEILYEIVRTRSEAQSPTVITSNLNLDAMSKRYTDRVTSRLVDMCKPVWCKGEDYRLRRAIEK